LLISTNTLLDGSLSIDSNNRGSSSFIFQWTCQILTLEYYLQSCNTIFVSQGESKAFTNNYVTVNVTGMDAALSYQVTLAVTNSYGASDTATVDIKSVGGIHPNDYISSQY
jgi:hypothetical protein